MRLRDSRMLARLMVIQRLSQRQLAMAAGWRSHTYVGRLLRGEVAGVEATAALRIAEKLGVPVEALFEAGSSAETGPDDKPMRSSAGSAAGSAGARGAMSTPHEAAVHAAVERHGLIGYYMPASRKADIPPSSARR